MEEKQLTKEQLKRREDFAKDMNESLKKHGLKMALDVDFPKYREIPEEALLALKVLENLGAKHIMIFEDIEISELKKDKK